MPSAGTVNFMRMALLAQNQWLENIAADRSNAPFAKKVIRNKPADLVNACWDDAGVMHDQPVSPTAPGLCNTLYPVHADPRLAAGGPRSGDILKCQLKPVKASDYQVAFTPSELARLKAIFSKGVCDWSKPGVRQRPQGDTWLAYPEPGRAVSLDGDGRHDGDRHDR
jgi:hypothetical protein